MNILQVERLKKYFPVHGGIFLRQRGFVHAVDDVSFDVRRGETLGLVGESGCGKTTLGRCVMGLYPLSEGSVRLHGQDISSIKSMKRDKTCNIKNFRLKMQMIFQDPFESLNSRHTVGEILEEKYIINNKFGNIQYSRSERKREIARLLERVGLSPDAITKFPHEFSGGQRQRIGIARAISLEPEVLICDEPVSALDVSVQSQILNLMLTLQKDMGLTCLFISHDLAVVRHVSDRIAVMYLGQIVEMADAKVIYAYPKHPYTEALLSAIPVPDPEAQRERIILKGEVPSPTNPPKGCRFNTRCRHVMDICKNEVPQLKPVTNIDEQGKGELTYSKSSESLFSPHFVACHLVSL
ncbi:MAG: ATP-binding cassette domain-containing protein [Desulfamplus sp.]|nr:ATP-binding cassette domain-containing protein [Desulfamplus sp.]